LNCERRPEFKSILRACGFYGPIRDGRERTKRRTILSTSLKEERKSLVEEQKTYVEKMIGFSSQIGELKTKLMQLGSGQRASVTRLKVISEGDAPHSETVEEIAGDRDSRRADNA
jgi:hypothetical protein